MDVTVNGIGERSGNAPLEEVSLYSITETVLQFL